jgi:hypothetical protein
VEGFPLGEYRVGLQILCFWAAVYQRGWNTHPEGLPLIPVFRTQMRSKAGDCYVIQVDLMCFSAFSVFIYLHGFFVPTSALLIHF